MPIQRVTSPPEDGSSYVLDRLDGEIFTMPGLKGVFRFYASQKQTDNVMSVFAWDGPDSDQPFHHHKKTHDCFLITEGFMKVYCDGESRILGPGDFASVPPFLVHKPTPYGPVCRAIPLISPADWVDVFRYFSVPFDGVMFPEFDDSKLNSAATQLDPQAFAEKWDSYPEVVENPPEPSPWSEKDHILPDGEKGYFLKSNKGPRWALGGVHSRPFITTKQCSGKFAISSIESSDRYQGSFLSKKLTFPVHHIFCFFDGKVDVTIGEDSEPLRAVASEVVVVNANTPFSLEFKSKYVRFYSWASGDGLEAVIHEAGSRVERDSLLNEALATDEDAIIKALAKFNIKRGN
ncbi:hypothetical protein ACHAPJ_009752 [Fusarium lateritium]